VAGGVTGCPGTPAAPPGPHLPHGTHPPAQVFIFCASDNISCMSYIDTDMQGKRHEAVFY